MAKPDLTKAEFESLLRRSAQPVQELEPKPAPEAERTSES